MPVVRHPGQLPLRRGEGWSWQICAGSAAFGEPVGMEASCHRLVPGAVGPLVPLTGQEVMAYVIAGAGTAAVGPDTFPLARESVLWLAACDSIQLSASQDGLEVLIAESGAGAGAAAPAPLCKVLTAAELPHLVSTRDHRDRLDLVTEDVPVGAASIRADRISFRPGDTAATHYHTECHHVFLVLAGSGLLRDGSRRCRIEAGMSALIPPGEVHGFENDQPVDFSFVQFWAPPRAGTVWTDAGDRCTWAPAN